MAFERNPLPVENATPLIAREAGPVDGWTRLAPQIRRLWRVEGLITALILLPLLGGGGALAGWTLGLPLPLWFAGLALALLIVVPGLVLIERTYLAWGYRLSSQDLAVTHGIYWKSERYVARERVQHVDVAAGPIARKLGICKLTIFTAGGMGPVVEIPGLVPEEAERLRRALLPERTADA